MDMSASSVGVGDGVPWSSEHARNHFEIRRLTAEIERRDAEIKRLDAEIEHRDALMMAEIRRLTAENEVLLQRERERERDAQRQTERESKKARHLTGRRTSLLTLQL